MRLRVWLWSACLTIVLASSATHANAGQMIAAIETTPATAPSVPANLPYRTHLRSHGDTTVWAAAASPTADAAIYAYNAPTQRTFVVASGAGNKSAPDVSDNFIVWEDARNTCRDCAHDIYGYDLATQREIAIAVGAPNVDRSAPAVSGRRVVWIEQYPGRVALRGIDLATRQRFTVADMAANGGDFYGTPTIDGTTVVYSEEHRLPNDQNTAKAAFAPHRLYAQTIGNNAGPQLIGSSPALSMSYALSSGRVVWTSGAGGVHAYDLANGQETLLSNGLGLAPVLDGDLAVWRDPSTIAPGIYGYDFNQSRAFLVDTAADSSVQPDLALAQRTLFSNGSDGTMQATRLGITFHAVSLPTQSIAQPAPAATVTASSKGMHAANTQQGWSANGKLKTAGIDALSTADGTPIFDSITVLSSDLGDSTGVPHSDKKRGPHVADAMRTFVKDASVTALVRLWPGHQPAPVGSGGRINPRGNPSTVADAYVHLARSYGWIADIQTDNEPNLEWNTCSGCSWQTWDRQKHPVYAYSGPFDPRLFDAINQYYVDAWSAIQHAALTNPNRNVRARLATIHRWSPPVSEYWSTQLSDGSYVYDHLKPMLDRYTYVDYHLYPDATYHSDGNGGLSNPVWNESFAHAAGDYVRQNITNGVYTTTVSEFGWGFIFPPNCANPPHTQNNTWVAACAGDHRDHLYESDIASIRANALYGAAAINVWLVQNWSLDYYANGYLPLAGTSTVQRVRWLSNYMAQ